MSDILIGRESGDMELIGGDIALVTGPELLGQRVADRLNTITGEWFLDLIYGVDYRRDFFQKNPSLALLRAIFVSAINEGLDGDGVLSDLQLTLDNKTRILTVSMIIRDNATQAEVDRIIEVN